MATESVLTEAVLDTLSTGLKTDDLRDQEPPQLNVAWLAWDSGFRGSGLRPGDRIVAVDGVALSRPVAGVAGVADVAVGRVHEPQGWKAQRASDGTPVRLTVRRRRIPGDGWQTLEITGRVRAERIYRNAQGQTLMGAGGPQRLLRDGFPDAWAAWYDKRLFDWQRQLDGTVWAGHTDTRAELARHLQAEPRVRLLAEHYPGAFAQAVLEDWLALRDLLSGRVYDVPADEYAYRNAEKQLTADITVLAQAEWQDCLGAHAAEVIEHPGPIRLAEGEHERLAGKLLVLPRVSPDAWVCDLGQIFISWRSNGGWAFTALEDPALSRLWQAQVRYRRHLSPQIDDSFALIGRIRPEPRMVSPKGQAAVIGLEVEPIAALMGHGEEQMFVDLAAAQDGTCRYAGEDRVLVLPSALPPAEASPRQVLQALIQALYARDVQTWFALFADWRLMRDESRAFYFPYDPYPEANRDAHWAQSRRLVLERTWAVRVLWVGEPRVVVEDAIADLPCIERVHAELDHVGCFEGEYHAFNAAAVHRHWTLERRDGGPWRITIHQGI